MIYLDHAATTPVCDVVLEAMAPYWSRDFANPASRSHRMGRQARVAVDQARDRVSIRLGLSDSERLKFTSGASESIRLAIEGAVQRLRDHRSSAALPPIVLTSTIEHRATRTVLERLQRNGLCRWETIRVDRQGQLNLADLRERITESSEEIALVSLILGHNEVGTVQSFEEVAHLLRSARIPLHWDAAQVFGKALMSAEAWGADWVSLSAHKLGGPKGVGALVAPDGLAPSQGTLPVPLIMGFATAVDHWVDAGGEFQYSLYRKRELLRSALKERLPTLLEVGDAENRLVNHLAFRVPALRAADWMQQVTAVAFSSGSACGSGDTEPSPTYQAMGFSAIEADEIVRLVVWHENSDSDLLQAVEALAQGARKILEDL